MSTRAQPVPHRVHRPHRWVVWLLVGLVAAAGYRRRHRPSVLRGTGAVFVAAGAVRGAGDRRPLRHLRRPGEPREAERPHDRAPCGRPTCVVEAGRKRRGRVPRGRAGGRSHRRGGHTEPAVGPAEPESRHPARRPARHRAIEPTRRRRDPVRDADGDGRPRRGAGSARLPAARRDRQLLRRHRGADLREPPSLLSAHAHPRWRDRDRRPLLRPLRGQRPARPRPTRETLRLRPRPAGGRSQAGSASSANS